jgi:molybdopterin converting factor small subunit
MLVEFFGIPRERAGVSEVELHARTLGEVCGALAARFPSLHELITADGLHPTVAASVNGDVFVRDLDTALAAGDRLLILSADAGG